jgi:hypothetical protein
MKPTSGLLCFWCYSGEYLKQSPMMKSSLLFEKLSGICCDECERSCSE